MKKRTWHYILPPTAYDMRCDKCWSGELDDDTGTNITWSEYEHMIWCFECEVDTEGFKGIFDGPIPIQAAFMIGIHFDRWNMETKQVEKFNIETSEWDPIDKVIETIGTAKDQTIRKLKEDDLEDPYGIHLAEVGSQHFKLVPREHNSIKCQNQKNPKQKSKSQSSTQEKNGKSGATK